MEILGDHTYMKLALELAGSAHGQTGINPMVGCVVVKEGRIIGMGAHLQMGKGHAEVNALNMAGAEAEGSTIYVTLEPCSHHGRTPPCADRLVRERVGRVVVAATDPNPKVAGRGIERLREAGIDVTVGILQEEAVRLNEKFNKYITTRMPFVTAKTASTLDGRIASRTGDSKWITSPESRRIVHQLRHQHQAILVGIGTVLQDDPQLTTRLDVPGLDPVRVIVDSQLRMPLSAACLADLNEERRTVIVTTERAPFEREKALLDTGAKVIRAGDGVRVDLRAALRKLGELEIGSILLEGGGTLNGAMLAEQLIDKLVLFFAPKLIGGPDAPSSYSFAGAARMQDAVTLERVQAEMIGSDVMISGYPRYPTAQQGG